MFVNHYEHTLDSKNRIVLPAKFRHALGERVYLAPQDNSLAVYSEKEYKKMTKRLLARIRSGELPSKLRGAIASKTVDVDIDSAGRITIPARLREFANLTDEVIVSGALTYVEIWEPSRFEAQEPQFASVVQEQFKDGGIIN